jgi:hypothetical protein
MNELRNSEIKSGTTVIAMLKKDSTTWNFDFDIYTANANTKTGYVFSHHATSTLLFHLRKIIATPEIRKEHEEKGVFIIDGRPKQGINAPKVVTRKTISWSELMQKVSSEPSINRGCKKLDA